MNQSFFLVLLLFFVVGASPAVAHLGRVEAIYSTARDGQSRVIQIRNTVARNKITSSKDSKLFDDDTFEATLVEIETQKTEWEEIIYRGGSLLLEEENNSNTPKVVEFFQYVQDLIDAVFARSESLSASSPNYNISNKWRSDLLEIWERVRNILSKKEEDLSPLPDDKFMEMKEDLKTVIKDIAFQQRKSRKGSRPRSISVKKRLSNSLSPRSLLGGSSTGLSPQSVSKGEGSQNGKSETHEDVKGSDLLPLSKEVPPIPTTVTLPNTPPVVPPRQDASTAPPLIPRPQTTTFAPVVPQRWEHANSEAV